MKLKLIALAALLATSATSFAAMDSSTTGNGSAVANFRFYSGNNDQGGDDMSAMFDLGVSLNQVLSWNGVAGFSRTWNLVTGSMSGTGINGSQAIGTYGETWNELINFASNPANIEFNVIALDSSDDGAVAGGARYLTTADVATFPALTNGNLLGFVNMNQYILANNSRGTHVGNDNGASSAFSGGANNTYFGSIGGAPDGDTWAGKTTADTTKNLATAQNFWYLTSSAPGGNGASIRTAFGYDLNGNGSIGAGEFGEWSVDMAAGTISYMNPVPEAETWAMLVAGLGLMGAVIRRRKSV